MLYVKELKLEEFPLIEFPALDEVGGGGGHNILRGHSAFDPNITTIIANSTLTYTLKSFISLLPM